jgi:hypothetical protein
MRGRSASTSRWSGRMSAPAGSTKASSSRTLPGHSRDVSQASARDHLQAVLAIHVRRHREVEQHHLRPLVVESRRFTLILGRLRIPVPALLTPGTCRVTHIDLGDGQFRFDPDRVHPLWGHTFHQSGVFADPVDGIEGSAQ